MKEKLNANELYDKAEDFAVSSFKLVQLQTVKKSSEVLASGGFGIMMLVALSFFFLLINFGISLWVGQQLNDLALGFGIVASIYFLFALILLVFKKTIINRYLKNWIINQFLSHSELDAIIENNKNTEL